jgi:hypothetical protein
MKLKKIDYQICRIVGNGAMSHPEIGEARLIPAVIIDPLGNRSIPELLDFHQTTPPGDTTLSWGSIPFNKRTLILNIEFLKPMEIKFGIEFDVSRDLNIIDGIVNSRALYLQCGIAGDKFSNFESPKVLIEVPFLGFDTKWQSLMVDALKRKYRKMNFTKKEAAHATTEHIRSMRELYNAVRKK